MAVPGIGIDIPELGLTRSLTVMGFHGHKSKKCSYLTAWTFIDRVISRCRILDEWDWVSCEHILTRCLTDGPLLRRNTSHHSLRPNDTSTSSATSLSFVRTFYSILASKPPLGRTTNEAGLLRTTIDMTTPHAISSLLLECSAIQHYRMYRA